MDLDRRNAHAAENGLERAMAAGSPLRGRVLAWDRGRGFGYVEHEGRRLFLHWRDFAERHRVPEVGDVVCFAVGVDKQGRPCAIQAVQVNDGGRIRSWQLGVLAALLVLPSWAALRVLDLRGAAFFGGWILLASVWTYLAYADDKRRAREKGWRAKESVLHTLELIGGWPGAFIAQRRLRHKATKGSYQFGYVLIVGGHQLLAIEALRGWPLLQRLIA